MYQLIQFFLRLRIFFTFLILEIFAIGLIINNNTYQGVVFFNSSNAITGELYAFRDVVYGQFTLRDEVEILKLKNAELYQKINNLNKNLDTTQLLRDTLSKTYKYIPARVINNTVRFNDNYLTLNKGSKDGIKVGMGVVSTQGVVGRIRAVSSNFATAYSLLHSTILVSAQLKKSKSLCTVKWNNEDTNNDYLQAELLYIPIHVEVNKGDTVVTSGYNAVFPEEFTIGV
ncbi:MAG: rod shape-determining protein MreC, partial [Bacteroidota bacterium]